MIDNQNPEQKARDRIDALLRAAGWAVQKKIDFSAGSGQAVREWHTDVGPADYVLFVDRKAVGVIEAKREETLRSRLAELPPLNPSTSRQRNSACATARKLRSPTWNNPSAKPSRAP